MEGRITVKVLGRENRSKKNWWRWRAQEAGWAGSETPEKRL